MPFGADIVRDKAQFAVGRRRARFGERIGQKDADPWRLPRDLASCG
jgi:hypothetical protein